MKKRRKLIQNLKKGRKSATRWEKKMSCFSPKTSKTARAQNNKNNDCKEV